jgi:hypothetical protein
MAIIRLSARGVLLLGVAAVLLACGEKQAASSDANAAAPEITTTAPANTAVAADAGNVANASATIPAALSADYMVGKWSAMGEDCSGTLEFRKNGTVATPIGEAKWTLQGDQLAIDYGDGSAPTKSTIKTLSSDRIEITHTSGTKETEKRC